MVARLQCIYGIGRWNEHFGHRVLCVQTRVPIVIPKFKWISNAQAKAPEKSPQNIANICLRFLFASRMTKFAWFPSNAAQLDRRNWKCKQAALLEMWSKGTQSLIYVWNAVRCSFRTLRLPVLYVSSPFFRCEQLLYGVTQCDGHVKYEGNEAMSKSVQCIFFSTSVNIRTNSTSM